ncbi:hypothetical protein ONS95_001616 [Cadophora gregata]|uniref:uncharacterized protein n=1 Tax=Cadophora gregata TaxID=51156 RepID=UPI0026DCA780|nr:uncharacterized protein ONS95_001616 [Cadophora gregata]KAK0111243.1 hypothetical protein ONS95_001616 [Cadophora gregata]KAK0112285.1 hypothetical protein ONS96_001533 [Cadophora gregata f. sp. sojae]
MFGYLTASFLIVGLSFRSVVAGTSVSGPRSTADGVAPVVTEVDSTGHVPLFNFETLQLTEEGLSQLDKNTSALFQFDNSDEATDELERRSSRSCKVFPGDFLWPSDIFWDIFNWVLGNDALIKTVPLASPCYNGAYYNAAKCATLYANWTNSIIHMNDPTSMMSPVYQGLTCEATLDPTKTCTLGAFPYYAVNATQVYQIQLAVNFARVTNIRLVVKNTGHDFSGKSGGAGALSIWTHNLKDIQYIPHYAAAGTNYKGPAFKAGAGVQAFEIYEEAYKRGLVVVGGEGVTVGVMGGYIQGGGHSPLSSLHGMASDQVLSMEVVTPDGRFVTADFKQNTELFWALRGGGGSTFGVVTSVTIKAYPDLPVTASTFSFKVGGNITSENFWKGFRLFLDHFPSLSAKGIYAYWFILSGSTTPTFLMQPFWAPGKTLDETNALLAPWFAQLNALNITFTPKTIHYDSHYTGWKESFPREAVSKTHVCTGSRLWPKQNWKTAKHLDDTFNAVKTSSINGLTIIGFIIDPNLKNGGNTVSAVNPAWRNTYSHMLQSVNWAEGASAEVQLATRQNFTFGHMQRWRDLSPGAGSYLGESDILEPNFQQSFYGSAYDRLLALKKKLDPKHVFFAQTAVGSENWKVVTENGLPSGNGRLCRV